MARLFAFLESVRAVFDGRACLAEPGCEYMGIRFRFPATETDPWSAEPKVLRAKEIEQIKQSITRVLDQAS